MDKRELFTFMQNRIVETSHETGLREPQAFARWFVGMYFKDAHQIYHSDGSGDGKVDLFFRTDNGRSVRHFVLNAKYTDAYNKTAPVGFYDEILSFHSLFNTRQGREEFLAKAVKEELRPHYKNLFRCYDEDAADLLFVTNCRCNDNQYCKVKKLQGIKVLHLDDLIQHMVDDIDGAMPKTPSLTLTGIASLVSPDTQDTEVPTSIVFAKVVDFIRYMQDDPADLLFARNVRLNLGNTGVNREIRETLEEHPKEFVFSNNGITLLCECHTHSAGTKELVLDNPRVVNGSQTLHAVRNVSEPSSNARVMVRIIEISPPKGEEVAVQAAKRREIINKISVRSNRQNPIKPWNLVANDEFQLDVFRRFRRKGIFYERRTREWNERSRQLRSVGIRRGPDIRWLTQLIASYKSSDRKLGPVIATRPGELFSGGLYDRIRDITPECIYQIYLVDELARRQYRRLAEKKQYADDMRGHIDLVLFTLIARALREAGASWGRPEMTALLEQHSTDTDGSADLWYELVQACARSIHEQYQQAGRRFRNDHRRALTVANFFKGQSYVEPLLTARVPSAHSRLARQLLTPA